MELKKAFVHSDLKMNAPDLGPEDYDQEVMIFQLDLNGD